MSGAREYYYLLVGVYGANGSVRKGGETIPLELRYRVAPQHLLVRCDGRSESITAVLDGILRDFERSAVDRFFFMQNHPKITRQDIEANCYWMSISLSEINHRS